MNSTSKHSPRYTASPLPLWAIALTLPFQFLTFAVSAQETATAIELDARFDAIRDLFRELDSSAQACVEESDADSCKAFAEVLDDTFIPSYLGHCAVIRAWRDQVVEDAESGAAADDEPGLANRLIGAEFSCGEDALAKRSHFAVAAFQKWQQENTHASQGTARYRQDGSDRTSPVPQALQSQQSRLSREIDQQWQRVELENIRQQLRKPIDYGDYNYPR